MTLPPEREVLYARDIQALTGLSRSAVHRALRAGHFGACRQMPNGRLFVLRTEYDAAIDQMQIPDPAPERLPRELRPREDLRRYFEGRATPRRRRKGATSP